MISPRGPRLSPQCVERLVSVLFALPWHPAARAASGGPGGRSREALPLGVKKTRKVTGSLDLCFLSTKSFLLLLVRHLLLVAMHLFLLASRS